PCRGNQSEMRECSSLLVGHEFDAVTSFEQKNRGFVGAILLTFGRPWIENAKRRVTDDVPAAGTFDGINTGVLATDCDRAGSNARARRSETRRVQTRIQIAEIREAGGKSQAIDFVDRLAVQLANLRDGQLMEFGDFLEVRSVVSDRDFVR